MNGDHNHASSVSTEPDLNWPGLEFVENQYECLNDESLSTETHGLHTYSDLRFCGVCVLRMGSAESVCSLK